MDLINEKTGRPPKGYTDLQWQQDFVQIKSKIQPSQFKRMKVVSEYNGRTGTYHGKTQYQYYCDSINDILSNIRKGETDYCYYIYQVSELLKYEHDRLQVVWLEDDCCFKLNLKK